MAPPPPLPFQIPSLFLVLSLLQHSSSTLLSLSQGSSLSVENAADVLVSPTNAFSAGFFGVGDNAYSFAIWHSRPACTDDCTPVWMANRDEPVNGKRSELVLLRDGNLILTDAGASVVWSSKTDLAPSSPVKLRLSDDGNLVLSNASGSVFWQSFDWPTDTLLPKQLLTRSSPLISSRSRYNYSAGFYKLYFDNDNILHILYDGPAFSSPFWPAPWLHPSQAKRFAYNSTRVAVLDTLGHFTSSDKFQFYSSDYGAPLQRRLTMDPDGNLRLYSRHSGAATWSVTWQAFQTPCFINGVCGNNTICSYDPFIGRICSCVPGYKRVDPSDWSVGCDPAFELSDGCGSDVGFVKVLHVDFYGYDYKTVLNTTLDNCRNMCTTICNCRGFQYTWSGLYNCYIKIELLNGHKIPSFSGDFYLKVNKSAFEEDRSPKIRERYVCREDRFVQLQRNCTRRARDAEVIRFVLWFAAVVGAVEVFIMGSLWFFFYRNNQGFDVNAETQSYFLATAGLQRFTYGELKKATKGFSTVIGKGAAGVVYKAVFPDSRIAAVKFLNEANTGEADFMAEVSTIGRLNHMNLIELWGFCVDGKKNRLLVYEYMEHGSLSENLSSPKLDWKTRFDIAVGTAKGLAYLHEECLEWVLHCDVKPQNILLDSEYCPKVADFGMSKLMDRGKQGAGSSEFSRVRGTRGYMAPEWVSNLPITSKVDVYSYGIVVLELVTGMNPTTCDPSLVAWARKKTMHGLLKVEEMVDPLMRGNYDTKKMEILVEVAMRCVAEDKDERPTMGQVVEMLSAKY